MIRTLIDTNIFLNVIRQEGRFHAGSGDLLRRIARREIHGMASCVVLMETKWVFHERGEIAKADKAISLVEELVEIVPVDREVAKEAIELKIKKKLELLDSIHVTTAIVQNAILVTRDEDLRKKCEDLVTIKTPEEIFREKR